MFEDANGINFGSALSCMITRLMNSNTEVRRKPEPTGNTTNAEYQNTGEAGSHVSQCHRTLWLWAGLIAHRKSFPD